MTKEYYSTKKKLKNVNCDFRECVNTNPALISFLAFNLAISIISADKIVTFNLDGVDSTEIMVFQQLLIYKLF